MTSAKPKRISVYEDPSWGPFRYKVIRFEDDKIIHLFEQIGKRATASELASVLQAASEYLGDFPVVYRNFGGDEDEQYLNPTHIYSSPDGIMLISEATSLMSVIADEVQWNEQTET